MLVISYLLVTPRETDIFVNEYVCFFISYAILRHVDCLKTFEIKHSLNTKDCPYDNAVAEAMMKLLKFHN
ncbi:hypothetical protein NGH30_02820 [Macrococcus caseolyticus]|uniref:hypothetical protein n=1 Tax=Macrococcoides caseolyticum TaxID=69966 RepID=UPI002DBFDBC0|nr:hypothetical protein [Macrococcus caseolyticus]MEB8170765.1 hypothetical protein [Macrococcus caseolyticus]